MIFCSRLPVLEGKCSLPCLLPDLEQLSSLLLLAGPDLFILIILRFPSFMSVLHLTVCVLGPHQNYRHLMVYTRSYVSAKPIVRSPLLHFHLESARVDAPPHQFRVTATTVNNRVGWRLYYLPPPSAPSPTPMR
jgi:hypothetical protein